MEIRPRAWNPRIACPKHWSIHLTLVWLHYIPCGWLVCGYLLKFFRYCDSTTLKHLTWHLVLPTRHISEVIQWFTQDWCWSHWWLEKQSTNQGVKRYKSKHVGGWDWRRLLQVDFCETVTTCFFDRCDKRQLLSTEFYVRCVSHCWLFRTFSKLLPTTCRPATSEVFPASE